jgi:hypothetical protein
MMDDERFYFLCPLRKNRARIAVTVCHGRKCIFLASEDGKLRCGYGDKNLPARPRVNRIDRDGVV